MEIFKNICPKKPNYRSLFSMQKTITLKSLPAPPEGKLRVVLDMDKTLIIAHKVDISAEHALGDGWQGGPQLMVAPNSSMGAGETSMGKPDFLISNSEIRSMGWPYAQDERQRS
eukprot:g1267.t1